MRAAIDISGQVFGRLTVKERAKPTQPATNKAVWLCECSCKRTAIRYGVDLRSGHVRSCGCLRAEAARTARRRAVA